MSKTKKYLLIDGDTVAYAAAFSCQKEVAYLVDGNFISTEKPDVPYAEVKVLLPEWVLQERVVKMIDKCVWACSPHASDVLICFTPPGELYRHNIFPEYKANRKTAKKPYYKEIAKQHMKDVYDCVEEPGLEADDLLGIFATNYPGSYICSIDKDLLMIPGLHYNWMKDKITIAEDPGYLELNKSGDTYKLTGVGITWFAAQMLLGDKVDNIPGLKGYGPLKTYNALKGKTNPLQIVYDLYSQHSSIKEFQTVADLLWIKRDEHKDWRSEEKVLEIKHKGNPVIFV